jgi:hypothetical protein
MKLSRAVLLASALPGVFSQAGDRPTTTTSTRTVAQIPSANPTLDPSWRHNRTRQTKHVHDFFRLFGWLRMNETIQDRDIPAAIRKIQRILRAPETGVYDERMETVMSRPRCGTIQPYNATDAGRNRPSKKKKRFVLWGPKWHHQTVTYRFVNYTSEVTGEKQRSILRLVQPNSTPRLCMALLLTA